MRLLVVNPNISSDVTELIRAEAERSAAPTTDLLVRTAPRGVEYIETRFESLLAAGAVAEVIAAHRDEVDGVLVAAFGDPGMPALKELVEIPVIGITEAALCAAALQGSRFSIIAISDRITAWYRECVEHFGFASRLASIRSLKEALRGIGTVQDDFRPTLVELARLAVAEDGADVVVLAGAPLAGLARDVASEIPVPVVDGIGAGVRFAEAVVGLRSGAHRAGSFAVPPPKRRAGLAPVLDAALDERQLAARPVAASLEGGDLS
ncbi:aspartate/glutamate racemase family protein [Sinomonas humi]|uniref:Asp/Glu/hydantoin racemase n=1 Tax=Sinomonas humi TaxID=1338436 RepID=A0A0B2AT13_9MICC|nr:aspartate/glutamate racemase family protein [Sinomonas humi]KHL05009.1 Asp/Glu/hydantoin racemase [Sinomonas humi]